MALFQKTVIKKYFQGLDSLVVQDAYSRYQSYFFNPQIQQNIRDAKEEQFQEGFLTELFGKILGYTLNPNPNYNLKTEIKNAGNSKKADGAIIIDTKVIAVIELKGTETTDLAKIETQAFGYKNNQPHCTYVIISNFEKLRFYIDNAIEYLEFNLFALTTEEFNLLWLCLSLKSIEQNIPKKLKEESLSQEDVITKRLYKDYSLFKRELYQDLVVQNAGYEPLELFRKSQKLLDRFLFLFFAEDRQLLPPNSVRLILDDWKDLQEMDEKIPLYRRFKKYFEYLNTGYKGKRYDVFAYNGGLFKPDEILDAIIITDDILYKHTLKLSEYDFASEVDVNILGHIFENSLNELDEIKAEIEGQQIDKTKTKRKKDGVFYTPKYITKYIVENTIGKLCLEKKESLKLEEEQYTNDKRKNTKTKKELLDKLSDYRQWLLQLTICDPACGSGAFLNQALEFLINEHRYIDELQAKLFGSSLILSDVENSILENNLFGVDINEESVEIAQLSLWLRTARKNRKLNSLNNNIKCGNSLIDDPEVAGEKAFNWQNEFPQVFAKGGFDVVIGNPPYVGEKGHSSIFENLKRIPKWKNYYRRRSNIYYFFIKQGIDLLCNNGIQSLIIPREFTTADWANKVRKEILEMTKIIEIVDFNSLKVFDAVGTTSLVITHTKSNPRHSIYNFNLKSLRNQDKISIDLFEKVNNKSIHIDELDTSGDKIWNFYQDAISMDNRIVSLIDLFDISQGLVTGADKIANKHIVAGLAPESILGRGIFMLKEGIDIDTSSHLFKLRIGNDWINLDEEDKTFIKPYIKTEGLIKWQVIPSNLKVIYIGNRDLTENIKRYLMQFSLVLLNRSTTVEEGKKITLEEFEKFSLNDIKEKYSLAGAVQKIMKRKKWYLPLYERTDVPFSAPKIIVNTKNMDKFTYSDKEHYSSGGGAGGQNFIYPNLEKDKVFYAELLKESDLASFVKYINAILNSEKIQVFIKSGQFNQLSTEKIGDIPIVKPSFKNENTIYQIIVDKTDVLTKLYNSFHKTSADFIKLLIITFSISETENLNNWYHLKFGDFITQLNQSIKYIGGQQLTKTLELEWMNVFETQKVKATSYMSEINSIEKQIDQMVYKLYDEQRIMEGK